MEIEFLKMQGCGDDVVVMDGARLPPEALPHLSRLASRMLDRGTGVGGMFLILLGRGPESTVRCFTPQGSETDLPCNGARCVARYATDSGAVTTERFALRTASGAIRIQIIDSANVRVDMGRPFGPEQQAQIEESPTGSFTRSILVNGKGLTYTPVSLGRPYAMVFVPSFSFPLRKTARSIAAEKEFPAATGIGFVQVCSRERLRLRFWEADPGDPGDACVCAAAALVASTVNGFTEREVFVRLPGGEVFLQWEEPDNHIWLTGPASYVFTGSYDFEPDQE